MQILFTKNKLRSDRLAMAAVPFNIATLEQVLANMLSPSPVIRPQAEALLKTFLGKEHRLVFWPGIMHLLRTSPHPEVRSWCAILIRKKLTAGDPVLFNKLPDDLCAAIKSELLIAVATEPENAVRSRICDSVAELAVICIYNEGACIDLFVFSLFFSLNFSTFD